MVPVRETNVLSLNQFPPCCLTAFEVKFHANPSNKTKWKSFIRLFASLLGRTGSLSERTDFHMTFSLFADPMFVFYNNSNVILIPSPVLYFR